MTKQFERIIVGAVVLFSMTFILITIWLILNEDWGIPFMLLVVFLIICWMVGYYILKSLKKGGE